MLQNVATPCDILQHVATRARCKQTMTRCRQHVALLWKPRLSNNDKLIVVVVVVVVVLSRPHLEAEDPLSASAAWFRARIDTDQSAGVQ